MKADFYVQLASSSPVKYSENFWTGYRYWIYENNDGKQERGYTIKAKISAIRAFEALQGKDRKEALRGAEYAKAERERLRREDELVAIQKFKSRTNTSTVQSWRVVNFDSNKWANLAKKYGRNLKVKGKK